jgi:hypothetical protein
VHLQTLPFLEAPRSPCLPIMAKNPGQDIVLLNV